MSYTIALAGKGGTGKTTIAALLVRLIKESGSGSVLAVDADPNSNLGECLGIEVKETIGSILDEVAAQPDKVPQGWTKDRFIEYRVQSAVQEESGFDIVTMGQPEGPGCYCYVNNILRSVMNKLTGDYDYIVIDNEAGLEHLSRRTTRTADVLLVVSDATAVGLKAAARIASLVKQLGIKTKAEQLIINRWDGQIEKIKSDGLGLKYIGKVPLDEEIVKISLNGASLWKLDSASKGLRALKEINKFILQN
jgi:CO dehydrogenase maturation factor